MYLFVSEAIERPGGESGKQGKTHARQDAGGTGSG
jgi:hypothetical protein